MKYSHDDRKVKPIMLLALYSKYLALHPTPITPLPHTPQDLPFAHVRHGPALMLGVLGDTLASYGLDPEGTDVLSDREYAAAMLELQVRNGGR